MIGKHRSRAVYLLALVLFLSIVTLGKRFPPFEGMNPMDWVCADGITLRLMKGVVFEHPFPSRDNGRLPDTPLVAYVFGGTQDSMIYKLRTVGQLYAEGKVRNILILHRPGITEYSPVLGRNLSNDEWATRKLKEEGVAVENVEFIPVRPALFDTFAEAREVSSLVRSRRMNRLILVSSTHHTKRVWLSVSHFNVDNAFESYIHGSEERAGIIELLRENLKLRIYRDLVLPIDHLRVKISGRNQLGTPAEFPSEQRPVSRWNSGRFGLGMVAGLPRDMQLWS